MEGVLVTKNVSVKLFSFFNGGSIGDHERVCQMLQLLQWRQYWLSITCLSNSSASSMMVVLGIKNVSVKLFSSFNGGSIGDQERVCQILQLLQWRQYWLSRTCLSNSSASSMEVILGIKKVSLKLFSSFNGRSICYQERVCQTLQLHKWRVCWWSRTCISNSLVPPMEGVLVIKNVSVKLFSSCNGRSIGYQERVCQTLQIHQWRVYWWSRTCLSNSLAPSIEGVLVIKNVSVKLFILINGGSVGHQECVCQTLQFLQWREYWWSWTCLPNASASSMETVLVIKIVSVKFFCFFNDGSIGDQERVCQILQLLQWRQYWLSRTCLSNSSASSMEVILGIKKVSLKLFSSFNGRSIGYQERVCQTLQLHKWRVYWWSRTCLSNSLAPSMEGVLVIKDVSVKHFGFINGGSIGDEERACQTLLLIYWREYWWSRTDLSNSSVSSTEGLFVTRHVSAKLFSFFNGGKIGNQERVCQTLQLH